MELSAERLSQIIGSLRGDTPGRNRRNTPRVGVRFRAVILPCIYTDDGIKPMAVRVRDLSAQGAGLMLPVGLPRGATFVLRLGRDGGDVRLLCRVRHCQRQSDGTFTAGTRFVAMLSEDGHDGEPRATRFRPAKLERPRHGRQAAKRAASRA